MGACRSCSNRSFGSFRLTSNADSAGSLFYSKPVRTGISLSTLDTRRIAITEKGNVAFSIIDGCHLTGFPGGKRLCSLLAGKTGYPLNHRFFHMHILQAEQYSTIGSALSPYHFYLTFQRQPLNFKYGYLTRIHSDGFGKVNH